MNLLKRIIVRLKQLLITIANLNQHIDEIRINQGVILSSLNEGKKSRSLKNYEFKVFSQWGEDGIIQHLTQSIEIKNKSFIEFGVEDFHESNCRFLMMKDNWAGFVMDGSPKNIQRLKQSYFYWKHDLNAVCAFITRENINDLLETSGFDEDLGILSVDLDGNDYYVLDAIENFKPRIVICEYNALFGASRKISIPYQPDFNRTDAHYSNLYWGASLAAMTYLADKKGYALVGTNSASCNAFYVRKDLLNDKLEVLSVEAAHSPSQYRESRDPQGNLTYASGDRRLDLIKGLPVFNVEEQVIEAI